MKYTVDRRRVYSINNNTFSDGPIIYWMSRDQRVHDNWALLSAQQIANRACPQFSFSQITVHARKSIDWKLRDSFSNRVATLRKCFSLANRFSTK